MSHANAPLTPIGRTRLAALIVDQGWPVRRAAERFQVSPATASKWAARYRAGEPLTDRSSRPHHSPARLSKRREHRIISLRFTRRWGPHRISYHLGIPRSTIERVITRYRMPLLAHLDQATGLPIRKPRPFATRNRLRVSWCMWTLRSSAVSLMAEDGEFMGEGQTSNGARCKSRIEQRVQAGNLRAATCTSITPSMTIHASRIQRSSLTRRRRAQPRSGSEPARSSPTPE